MYFAVGMMRAKATAARPSAPTQAAFSPHRRGQRLVLRPVLTRGSRGFYKMQVHLAFLSAVSFDFIMTITSPADIMKTSETDERNPL